MAKENGGSIQRWAKAIGFFTVLLGELLGSVGAGALIGYLAWTKLGMPGWVIVPTTFLGLGLAAYRLSRFWKIEEERDEDEEDR